MMSGCGDCVNGSMGMPYDGNGMQQGMGDPSMMEGVPVPSDNNDVVPANDNQDKKDTPPEPEDT